MSAREVRRVMLVSALLLWAGLVCSPALRAGEAWSHVQHPDLDFLFLDAMEHRQVFHRFFLEPVSVWHPEAADPRRVEQLQERAQERLAEALTAGGLVASDHVGDGVLVVHVELIDLKSSEVTDEVMQWAERFRFNVAAGRITLVAELRDGETGRVLARLADLEEPGGERELWSGVDQALSQWGATIADTVVVMPTQRVARNR